ncbi:MAG: hypothetical protein H6544_05985 [Prevotellaceae bacterium]|nr:hypothetical protein [Prevotellaceae bacterium]
MENFFGSIYCWFESLFGANIAEYLWGYNCGTQDYTNPNVFNKIGLLVLLISLVLSFVYYYVLNSAKWNRWWHWLIVMFVCGIVNFYVGVQSVLADFLDGNIGDCLMYTRDENSEIISQLINESDCWMFGVANMIVSMIFFFVLSFVIKWKSTNCKHTPFL